MIFGVPRLKRTLSLFSVLMVISLGLIACGYKNSSQQQGRRSGLKFRAFVSNPLHPGTSGGGFPALEIINATRDLVSGFGVSLSGLSDAGMMVLSPKKTRTLVISPSSNQIAVVDNASETSSGVLALSGLTESVFVASDDLTAFVAEPSAIVSGQPTAGLIERFDIVNGTKTASIPLAAARFLIPSPSGNQILVLSDGTDTVTMLAPALITGGNPLVSVSGSFDKPVWAVFTSDGSTAYVLNCGRQCGGVGVASGCPGGASSCTSIMQVDMTQNPPAVTGSPLLVSAATMAFLNGTNLYVAGTSPAQNDCTGALPATSSTACGRLTVVDTASFTAGAPIPITDGYHDHMALGANGQLFIGAHTCTNINVTGSNPETRGCLTIVGTGSNTIVVPPDNGNVTGIEPVPGRNVVYVCEGGKLRVYDTTTDKLQVKPLQPDVIGQPIDVKVVD